MDIYETYIENVIQLAEEAIYEDKYDEAEKLLKSGLLEEPGYAKLHFKLGDLYQYNLQHKAQAERFYQLAIHFNPKYQEAYEELVALYLEHNKFKGIEIWMRKAERVKELNKAFVYENLGKVSEKKKRYKHALVMFKKALMESLDNHQTSELKKHIKRIKYKRSELCQKRSSE